MILPELNLPLFLLLGATLVDPGVFIQAILFFPLGDILHLQLHYVAVLSEEEEKLVVVNSVAFEVEKVKIYLNNDLKSEYTVMPPPP